MRRPAQWQELLQATRAAYTVLRRALVPVQRPSRAAMGLRGVPRLVRDSGGRTRCTCCAACVEACPMQCIHVDCERPQIAIAVEQARCMRYGICADVCPVDALALTGAAGRGDREGKA